MNLTAQGSGVITFSEDADTNLQITAAGAPGLDMLSLTNSGQGATVNGVDGLSASIFTATGAGANNSALHAIIGNAPVDASDILNGLEVTGVAQTVASTNQNLIRLTPASSGNSAGTLTGLQIDNITTPGNATENAITVGTGWDTDINLTDTTSTIAIPTGGSLVIKNGTRNILAVNDLSTNFGAQVEAGAFLSYNSYIGDEFFLLRNAVSANTAQAWGDIAVWSVNLSGTCSFANAVDYSGVTSIACSANPSIGLLSFTNRGVTTLRPTYNASRLPLVAIKGRINTSAGSPDASHRAYLGLGDMTVAAAGPPNNGIFFSNCSSTDQTTTCGTTWNGVVRTGGSSGTTSVVTCPGSFTPTLHSVLIIKGITATSVSFYVDNDVSDGVAPILCGTLSTNVPNADLTGHLKVDMVAANTATLFLDYFRTWQDDPAGGALTSSAPVEAVPAALMDLTGQSSVTQMYPSEDLALPPGTLLALDTAQTSTPNVVPATVSRTLPFIGIVSSDPGVTLDNGSFQGVRTAISGRSSILVSTENGPIEMGDELTVGSQPGIAVKAIKSGQSIGRALGFYSGSSVGQVPIMIQIQNRSTAHTIEESLGIPAISGEMTQNDILSSVLLKQGSASAGVVGQAASSSSDLFLDRLVAGLSIVTPTLTVQDATISGTLSVAGTTILHGLQVESLQADSIQSPVLASVTGTLSELQASTTVMENLLSMMTDRFNQNDQKFAILGAQLASLATAAPISVATSTFTNGLTVDGAALFHGGLQTDSVSSLADLITFQSDVFFVGHPYFNSDSGGFAVIRQGQTEVSVHFEHDYIVEPVVNTSISFNESDTSSAFSTDTAQFFASDLSFIIKNKSTHGFTIVLNKPAPADVSFSWMAMSIKNAQTSFSEESAQASADLPIFAPPASIENALSTSSQDVVTSTASDFSLSSTTPAGDPPIESINAAPPTTTDDTATDIPPTPPASDVSEPSDVSASSSQ